VEGGAAESLLGLWMPSTGIPQDSCAERTRILCGTPAVPVTCLMFPHRYGKQRDITDGSYTSVSLPVILEFNIWAYLLNTTKRPVTGIHRRKWKADMRT
jgi:hypothetical protein